MAKIMSNVWVLAIEFTGNLVNKIATFRDGQCDHANIRRCQTIQDFLRILRRVQILSHRADNTCLVSPLATLDHCVQAILRNQCIPHEVICVKQSHSAHTPITNAAASKQIVQINGLMRPMKAAHAHMNDARS